MRLKRQSLTVAVIRPSTVGALLGTAWLQLQRVSERGERADLMQAGHFSERRKLDLTYGCGRHLLEQLNQSVTRQSRPRRQLSTTRSKGREVLLQPACDY